MAESSPSGAATTSDPDRIDEEPTTTTTTTTTPPSATNAAVSDTFEVNLNVYDASSANPFLRLLGLGLYRSSVLDPNLADTVGPGRGIGIFRLQNEFNMATYHPLTKNSHHFADRLCGELTGSGIPTWVNRITIIWPLCKCLLPPDPEEVHRAERRNIMFSPL